MRKDVFHETRHLHLPATMLHRGRLLLHNRKFILKSFRITSANLNVETVFQWRDDSTPTGVIFRISAGHDDHVERQPNLIALDLYVLFFHEIKYTDLHS